MANTGPLACGSIVDKASDVGVTEADVSDGDDGGAYVVSWNIVGDGDGLIGICVALFIENDTVEMLPKMTGSEDELVVNEGLEVFVVMIFGIFEVVAVFALYGVVEIDDVFTLFKDAVVTLTLFNDEDIALPILIEFEVERTLTVEPELLILRFVEALVALADVATKLEVATILEVLDTCEVMLVLVSAFDVLLEEVANTLLDLASELVDIGTVMALVEVGEDTTDVTITGLLVANTVVDEDIGEFVEAITALVVGDMTTDVDTTEATLL